MIKQLFFSVLLIMLFSVPSQSVYAHGKLENQQGQWVLIENGQIQKTFVGLVQHQTNKRWFYVKNGEIDWKFTGLVQHQMNKRWFYVKNGEIDWKFTGLVQHQANKRWFYVKNGEIDWKFTGLVQHQTNKRWFYVKNGEIDWKFTGLAQNPANKMWFYVKNGEVDWFFTDAVKHTDGKLYYVVNGKLSFNHNGLVVGNNKLYYVNQSVVNDTMNDFVLYNDELLYMKNGVIDWSYSSDVTHRYNQKEYTIKQNKAILQGEYTKIVVDTTERAFQTRYVESEQLEKGMQQDRTKGVKGVEKNTYRVTYRNGVEVSRVLQSTHVTPPVDRVVEIGVRETRIETRTSVVPFAVTQSYSDDVPKGKTEVVKGINGQVQEIYTVTYVKGVKRSSVKTQTKVVTPVKNQVDMIGTGIQTYWSRYDWDKGTFIAQKEEDTTRDTIAEVKRLNEDTKHILYSHNVSAGKIVPVYSPSEMSDILNRYISVTLFNQEFLKLLQAHRKLQGIKELQLDDKLIKAASIRSQEQASIGDLRTNGKSHTRPNGSSWDTVENEVSGLVQAGTYLSGENILARSDVQLYMATHEKELARLVFEQWKASDGHNKNMLSHFHSHFGVGFGFATQSVPVGKYPFVATTIFQMVMR